MVIREYNILKLLKIKIGIMRRKKKKFVTQDTFELQFGQKAQKLIINTQKYKTLKSTGVYLNGKPYINENA